MSDFICQFCGHEYKGHSSIFGKVCVRCGHVTHENSSIRDYLEQRQEKLQNTIREYLRFKTLGDFNADQRNDSKNKY